VAAFSIRQSPEFSSLGATLSDDGRAELARVYRVLTEGPLPNQSLPRVEPYRYGAC
jgi:hypothetical protein